MTNKTKDLSYACICQVINDLESDRAELTIDDMTFLYQLKSALMDLQNSFMLEMEQ